MSEHCVAMLDLDNARGGPVSIPIEVRTSKVRHAMHILIPRTNRTGAASPSAESKISVIERRGCIRVEMDVDNDGLGVKHVDLSVADAIQLAMMLHRIRFRLTHREGPGK